MSCVAALLAIVVFIGLMYLGLRWIDDVFWGVIFCAAVVFIMGLIGYIGNGKPPRIY